MKITYCAVMLPFLLLALLGGGQACDTKPTPVANWTMDSMYGIWYEQANYFHNEDEIRLPYRCVRHSLEQGFWIIKPAIDYERYKGNDGNFTTHDWEMMEIDSTPGGWKSVDYWNSFSAPLYVATNVATDYNTYTVQFQCWTIWEGGVGRSWEVLSIWTRERTPSEALITELEPIVESVGFNLKNFARVDQSDCHE